MHKNIFGMTCHKSTTKEYLNYLCQIVKTPQGSNDFTLLFSHFSYLRHILLNINEPETLALHLAYISVKNLHYFIFFKLSRVCDYHRYRASLAAILTFYSWHVIRINQS